MNQKRGLPLRRPSIFVEKIPVKQGGKAFPKTGVWYILDIPNRNLQKEGIFMLNLDLSNVLSLKHI